MKEADLVIAIGRKLDYQTGYGSPAVLPNARWIRIGDNAEELRENRRGEVELFAHPGLALAALAEALPKARVARCRVGEAHAQRARAPLDQVRGRVATRRRATTATCTPIAFSPRCARC